MSRDLFYDSEREVFPMIEKIQGFLPLVLAPSGLLKRGNLHTYQQQASVQCICVEYIIMAFGRPTNNNFSFTPLQIPRGIQNSENTHFEIHKTCQTGLFIIFNYKCCIINITEKMHVACFLKPFLHIILSDILKKFCV